MEKSTTGINIMNLLAKSVAKINAMEDINVKKKKLESKIPSNATKCPDTAYIIYDYLRRVSPSIASSFLNIHPGVDMDCFLTLEEVVQEWKKPCKRNEGKVKAQAVRKTSGKMYKVRKSPFTPREDSIILSKMGEMGDSLNIGELSKELGRNRRSVWDRVEKLKCGEGLIKKSVSHLLKMK